MLRTVRKAMEKSETNIQAQEIILHGIKAAVTQGTDKIDEAQLSFRPSGIIRRAFQEQNEIGWTNFYKGRISTKWEQVQQSHYNRSKPKKADTNQWATAIISAMWQGFLLMWEDRNDDQHGRDSIEIAVKERELLLQKVHQLYNQKESIDPEDRRLYHKPAAQWEEETNKKIREWIKIAEPLTKNIKRTTKTKRKRIMDPMQLLIKNIFTIQRNEAVPKNTRTYTKRPPRPNQDEE